VFGDVRCVCLDVVLMFLVGVDVVMFNCVFVVEGFDMCCLWLSTLIDENMLVGSGVDNMCGIRVVVGYFEVFLMFESLDFGWRYM